VGQEETVMTETAPDAWPTLGMPDLALWARAAADWSRMLREPASASAATRHRRRGALLLRVPATDRG